MTRTTRTYAELEISRAAYEEIAKKLRAAGYDHVFLPSSPQPDAHETIDMHGIALVCAPEKTAPPIDPQLLDDTRKLLGKKPYNHPSNFCWNDNYFAKSLTDRWGERACEAARKAVEAET